MEQYLQEIEQATINALYAHRFEAHGGRLLYLTSEKCATCDALVDMYDAWHRLVGLSIAA